MKYLMILVFLLIGFNTQAQAQNNDVGIRCINGYLFAVTISGGIAQIFGEGTYTKIPQPISCK